MSEAVVVQAPASGKPQHLFLLHHGVGATERNLVPLGRAIAEAFPQAAVVSMPAGFESDLGAGRQWFSVRGVNDENRGARIVEAMPAFDKAVREQEEHYGVGAAQTTLVGFSQGSIMSLEAARMGLGLAHRIVSIAGRFAELPDSAPQGTRIHFIHGTDDGVVTIDHAVNAAERLRQLGADVTIDVLPGTGHEITAQMVQLMLAHLARD